MLQQPVTTLDSFWINEQRIPRGEGAGNLGEREDCMTPVVQHKPRRDVHVQTNLPVTLFVKSKGQESMDVASAAWKPALKF